MFGFTPFSLERGIRLMRRREYGEALAFFRALVEKKPHLPDSYFNLGKCYFKMGSIAEAKEWFTKALERNASPAILSGILEVTNWRLLSPYRYFNGWPVFSPDGRYIAFASARRDTNHDGKINAFDRAGIYCVDTATGNERELVPDRFFNAQPSFSPDGKMLAYLSSRSPDDEPGTMPSGRGLYVLDLATGEERCLLDERCRVKHHLFTPDGNAIIFSCWMPGNRNSGIYSFPLPGGPVEVVVPNAYENTFPSVSPGGGRLVYCSWRRDTNNDGVIDFHDRSSIFMKHFGKEKEFLVAPDRYNNMFPVFSPDGERVVYCSVRRDTNRDGVVNYLDNAGIYIADLARKKEYCLVDDAHFNKFPSFTPDGGSVVFVSNWRRPRASGADDDLFENKGIYVIDVYGRASRQLVSDKYYGSRSPVVSPQGDRIAFISWRRGTNRGLYLARREGLPTRDELRQWISTNL